MRSDKRRSYTTAESNSSDIVFDITSRLKIPTASVNQNLVSRQVDYAAQGGVKTVSKFRFNATFGYRILGNPSGIIFITSCTVPREWVADRRRIQQSEQASM